MKKLIAFVFSILLCMSVLFPSVVNADAAPKSSAFASATGTEFMVDGHSFYFAGTNCYDLFTYGDGSSTQSVEDIENKYMDKAKIDTIMQQMKDDGISVVRTWGFSNESWHGFETEKGIYNEAQFMLFDYIMYSAQQHNIKIMITLENYWEAYGGIDKKLQWEGLNGGNHTARTQFFTNANCKQHYKDYAEHFINRINHYTGVAYKDDPTIFAWDLMNEPRYQDAPVNENTTGITLREWIDEMAAFIKNLDANHMVCVGLEGHETKYNFGGDEGNPFVYIHQSPNIDFCQAHPYPDEHWADLSVEQTVTLMEAWINDAHHLVGKPFIVGEFNTHNNKDQYWPAVFDTIYNENAAGGLFWEYNCRALSDFTVLHGDSILTYYKQFSDNMAAKNSVENAISPTQATFDRLEVNQADIALALSLLQGNTLTSINNGSNSLVEGTDYTISGQNILLKKSFLATLPLGNTILNFCISSGNTPSVTITVIDSGISNSTINPTSASFDKNVEAQSDITVDLTLNGNTLDGIMNGSTQLTSGTDYILSGTTVTIKKSYLATLNDGAVNLTFDFNHGADPELSIAIVDTTGQAVIEDFESYGGSTENLRSTYVRNSNGNSLTLSLIGDNEANHIMSFHYIVNSPDYAGATKNLANQNLSGYSGISFWLHPDGSNRDLTIQFKESSGEYWEAITKLIETTPSIITIPFSDFARPSWYSGGNGTLDLGSIAEYSIYVNQRSGSTGNDTIYFDNFKLSGPTQADDQAPTAPDNLVSSETTDTSVKLSWSASSDNIGVTAYNIYGGTALVGSTSSTDYTVTGLSPETTYSFSVKAKDAAGNTSPASSAVSVTTQSGSGPIYSAWDVNKQYVGGEIVTHNNKLWRAEWWTNHEEPGTTGKWGVWREYTI